MTLHQDSKDGGRKVILFKRTLFILIVILLLCVLATATNFFTLVKTASDLNNLKTYPDSLRPPQAELDYAWHVFFLSLGEYGLMILFQIIAWMSIFHDIKSGYLLSIIITYSAIVIPTIIFAKHLAIALTILTIVATLQSILFAILIYLSWKGISVHTVNLSQL